MNPLRALPILAALLAFSCHSSESEHDSNSGWMGESGAFEMTTEEVRWGFTVEGADLVLRYGDDVEVVPDFVPEQGLRYELLDESPAHARFHGAGGRTVVFRDGEVREESD